ncbi:MAG: hypothetical protein OZ948_05035 [Deltaproteobacteria bacterium]|nr:hypothetical protein [Deltaproteobacteria bacterium]
MLLACGPSEEEVRYQARRAELERRARGLRELVADAEQGSLIPTDRFFVGVGETLVQDLFRSQLPLEQPLEDRFVVRLESAAIELDDKYGAVRIEGRIHPVRFPARQVALRIEGGLGEAAIDPATGILRVRVAIDHIDIAEAGGLERVLGRGVISYLGGKGRELLEEAIPPIEVPVTLERAVPVPAVEEGGVRFAALEVPLEISVERVLAVGGKLWVVFAAGVGPVKGGEQGLGVELHRRPEPAPETAP